MKALLWALAFVAACGAGLAPQHPSASGDLAGRLVDLAAHGDAEGIAKLFYTPLAYGGIWFPDPGCRGQFPTRGNIDAAHLVAFSACLAKLPLRRGTRETATAGLELLEYAPGFEIEIQSLHQTLETHIIWIGYANRRDTRDALPSISAGAMAALRTDQTRLPALPELAASAKSLGHPYELAWLKVCIDASGSVTGIHVAAATSPLAEETFAELAKRWTFAPFVQDGVGIPVCSLISMRSRRSKDKEYLPLDVPPPPGMHASILGAKRLAGEKQIVPDDDEKRLLQRKHVERLFAGLRVCFDETGAVEDVFALIPSGLEDYDRRLATTIKATWRYQPVLLRGTPIKACTVATFAYSQR